MRSKRESRLFVIIGGIGLIVSLYFLLAALQDRGNNDVNIDDIVISGAIDSGSPLTGITLTAISGSVNVLIPDFAWSSGLQNIKDTLANKDVTVNFIRGNARTLYATLSGSTGDVPVDIVLVPSDVLLSYIPLAARFTLGEQIGPYFHPMFSQYVDQEGYSFFPFGIDVPVTYINHDALSVLQDPSLANLYAYLVLRTQSKPLPVPLLWGIGNDDIRFLLGGNESFPGYSIILASMLRTIQTNNNVNDLQTFLDIASLNAPYSWEYKKLYDLGARIERREPGCLANLQLCMLAYNYGKVARGMRSDRNLWQDVFASGSVGLDEVQVQPFAFTQPYFARGWGRIVLQGSSKQSQAAQFLQEYMKLSVNDGASMHVHDIDAGNAGRGEQLSNDEDLAWFKSYEYSLQMMVGSVDTMQKLLRQTSFLSLLKGEYSPQLFLENFTWVE